MVVEPEDVEILAAISKTVAAKGYPPTYRDVARATGISLSVVHRRIGLLREGGLVRAEDAIARSLVLTELGRTHVRAAV
jgi:DNA-binding transcriptional ArsR family regulator